MNLTDVQNAIFLKLDGLVLTTDESPTFAVPTIVGIPEPDYFVKQYPLISSNLMSAVVNYERRDNVAVSFGHSGTSPFVAKFKDQSKPYDLMYQIECWSRITQHSDAMMKRILKLCDRNSSYLEIKPVTLTADVATDDATIPVDDAALIEVGDWLTLDNRGLDLTSIQVFIVTAKSGNNLTVEGTAQQDFPAATTRVYERRIEIAQMDNGSFSDFSQDASKPYIRRTFTFLVWGYLDEDPVLGPYVKPEDGEDPSGLELNLYPLPYSP